MRVYVRRIRPDGSAAQVCVAHTRVLIRTTKRNMLKSLVLTGSATNISKYLSDSPPPKRLSILIFLQTGAISEGDTLVTVDGKNVYGLSLTTLVMLIAHAYWYIRSCTIY